MNNLYGLAVSKKLSVNGFKWVENTSQFSQDFIENYHEDSNEGCSFEIHVQYPERTKAGILGDLHDKKRICCTHKKFQTSFK